MNLRIKILAFVLATVGLGVNAQTTFEEISADLNKAGGVYLAYPKVEAKQTPAPKGYKPFYVSHYGRHGSRYLLGDRDYLWIIQLMQKADSINGLTPLGKDVLKRLSLVWQEGSGLTCAFSNLRYSSTQGPFSPLVKALERSVW